MRVNCLSTEFGRKTVYSKDGVLSGLVRAQHWPARGLNWLASSLLHTVLPAALTMAAIALLAPGELGQLLQAEGGLWGGLIMAASLCSHPCLCLAMRAWLSWAWGLGLLVLVPRDRRLQSLCDTRHSPSATAAVGLRQSRCAAPCTEAVACSGQRAPRGFEKDTDFRWFLTACEDSKQKAVSW